MEKPIIRDTLFLGMKAPAFPGGAPGEDDLRTADDLRDTLSANAERCVGLAANMIGERRRILVFDAGDGAGMTEMFDPVILAKSGAYRTEEGCLSLDGVRSVTRYRKIKVRWTDRSGKQRLKTFEGFPAQIIQHETDHFEGILI